MDVAAVGVTDAHVGARAAHDGREGVQDGHRGNHERHGDGGEAGKARDGEKRGHSERKAQREGAGVTHEDGRRVEVVAEKAQRGAHDGDGERRRVEPAGPDREHEHGHARDGRDAGRKAVQAVDEVDDVDVGNQVDHGERVGNPPQVDEAGGKRVGDVAYDQAARDGDDGRQDLPGELLHGLQRELVVKQARGKDHAEGGHKHPVVDLHARRGDKHHGPAQEHGAGILDEKRGGNAREDGDAAHARDGRLVDAAGVGLVDGAQADGQAARQGRRYERGGQRRHKQAGEGYPVRDHARHVRSSRRSSRRIHMGDMIQD